MISALLFFLGFNAIVIHNEHYWADEIYTIETADLPGPNAIWQEMKNDIHMPLYYLSLHYFMKIAQPVGIHFRWLSVFWGLLGLAGIYFWIKRDFSGNSAVLALALLAVSPFFLNYCRELRMYSMLAALLWWGASMLSLAMKTNRRIYWFLAALFNAMALGTHGIAFFFILSEILAMVLFRRASGAKNIKETSWKISLYAFLLLSVPFAGLPLQQIVNNSQNHAWLQTPQWHALIRCYFVAYTTFSAFCYAPLMNAFWIYAPFLVIVAMFAAAFLPVRQSAGRKDDKKGGNPYFPRILLISTAIIPNVVMFVLSFSPMKFFLEWRYSIISLGPFLAVLALQLDYIPRIGIRRTLFIALSVLSLAANMAIVTGREKPDWSAIVESVDRYVQEDDILVVTTPYFCNAYRYYSTVRHDVYDFDDLILQSGVAPKRIYHLFYMTSGGEDLHQHRITLDYIFRNFRHDVLFAETWYCLMRYDDIDWPRLRKWYLGQKTKSPI